jgi:hypothetical protein
MTEGALVQQQTNDKPIIFLMLAVVALAIVLVDDRWVRLGFALPPAFLLARRALVGSGVRPAADAAVATPAEERRSDRGVRQQIQDLLALIREFYTTCHMVAVGQLEPSKAKAKAQVVEGKLNEMMASMLETLESDGSAS